MKIGLMIFLASTREDNSKQGGREC